jgi:hypothetical protein
MATQAEMLDAAERLIAKGRKEEARELLELAQQMEPSVPLTPQPAPFPTFAPTSEMRRRVEQAAREAAQQQVEARGPFVVGDPLQQERDAERRAREELERQRGRLVVAGEPRPLEPGTTAPFSRASRVVEAPGVLVAPVEGTGVLAPDELARREAEARVPVEGLPAPLDIEALEAPELVRFYRDPDTGKLRRPSVREELGEAFQLQTEVSEERFREEERVRGEQQREIDRRLEAGEDVPVFERYVGPLVSGVLTKEQQGAGVVETPLGAALRSALGWVSVAAAEGYFRGLGYEVDERGLPRNADDLGYELAKLRERAGLPEVVRPTLALEQAVTSYADAIGADPETRKTITNALSALPQLAVPLPGVATQRQTRKVTSFDPEGRRRVTDVEAPDPLEQPQAFLAFEARRLSENLAKGRTLGDEWADTPAVRDYYAQVTGDPDAAFIAGLVPEVILPAGPEVLLGIGYVADAARSFARAERMREVKAAQAAAQAAARSRDFVRGLSEASPVRARLPELEARAAQLEVRALEAADQAAANVSPGVVQAVARKAARLAVVDEAKQQAFIEKLGAVNVPSDVAKVADEAGLTEADKARVVALTSQNTPSDYVFISDFIGVPRTLAPEASQRLAAHRRATFVRTPDEVADVLRAEAAQASGPVQAKLFELAARAPADVDAIRKQATLALRESARARGLSADEAAIFARSFDQRPPSEALPELARYATWSDVPAAARRQAQAAWEVKFLDQLGPMARRAADLTRAKVWFDGTESVFNGLTARKARALAPFVPLDRGTLAAARAAREIQAKGISSLRELKGKLTEATKRTGSVDGALDELMAAELTRSAAARTPAPQAWEALFEAFYGARKDAAKERAASLVNLEQYPTIAQVRALDRLLEVQGIVTGKAPDFRAGFLKVIHEQGLKKALSAEARDIFAAQAAVDLAPGQALADIIQRFPQPGAVRTLPVPNLTAATPSTRIALVDPTAGEVERALSEGVADGLFTAIDSVPVRARGATSAYLQDAIEHAASVGRRDSQSRFTYGYVLPNVPVQLGRLAQLGLLPMATIGARRTLEAAGLVGRDALDYATEAVFNRRMLGTGIVDDVGVYYSPKMIDDLARSYGVGTSAVEAERVGSLGRDLLREAQAAAAKHPRLASVLETANPLDRGLFLRFAEALELNFRRSVFELALAAGRPPAEAADLAKRSQLDFDATPEFVRNQAARWLGESAWLYAATTQALSTVAAQPRLAVATLQAARAKAEAQDPYSLHGDKALTTLGIIEAEGNEYYLPSVPAFKPLEAAVGAARRADLIVRDIRTAYGQGDAVDAGIVALEQGAGSVANVAAALMAPEVLEAWERYDEGAAYVTNGIPTAEPLSDEKAFWALAMNAHVKDPSRLPGGEWEDFLRLYQPELVLPPADLADKQDARLWTGVPPEGTPHLRMGTTPEGRELWMSFKPSATGLKRLSVLRALTPDNLEQALQLYSAFNVDSFKARDIRATAPPFDVVAQPVLAPTLPQAAAELVLPRVTVSPAEGRRRQAEAVRAVRENVQ